MARNRPSQRDLEKVAEKARTAARELAGYFSEGRLSATDTISRFETMLINRFAAAASLGRRRGGSFGMDEEMDRRMGEAVVEEERPYLEAFAEDLAGGRYVDEAGGVRAEAIEKRMDLYIKKITPTANEAMTIASDPDLLIEWVLGATEHCEPCVGLAAGSPYRAEEMPAQPGDGSTPCVFNCACSTRRADGLATFEAV